MREKTIHQLHRELWGQLKQIHGENQYKLKYRNKSNEINLVTGVVQTLPLVNL